MFEAALTAQKRANKDKLMNERDFRKGVDHLLSVSSWRYQTRRKLSGSHKTRLHFPFWFFFWFRWLESQSSQLQIRNRDPPIDDPHTHRWVHVTKEIHYRSSSPRLPKATSTPTAGSAPGANSAKKHWPSSTKIQNNLKAEARPQKIWEARESNSRTQADQHVQCAWE